MPIQPLCFQEIILTLQTYWSKHGCALLQPYDCEMGAGTFHPGTTLRSLGSDPWRTAYVQPSRRPTDGRYGENPNRLYRHHQFQVILKPSPDQDQELCLASLKAIGLDPHLHDFRFVEDDWESPTLGAAGLGWEVWCDGQEVVQYTYFQQMGGIECHPVSVEMTYGLERLAMALQGVSNVYEIDWNGAKGNQRLTYQDVCHRFEYEFSKSTFEYSDALLLQKDFEEAERECSRLLREKLALPAYDWCLKASHIFNLLDARGAIGVLERAGYIGRVRALAKKCCDIYMVSAPERTCPLPLPQAPPLSQNQPLEEIRKPNV